jgi:exodeoxyribonuclease V alpha subunit
MSGQTQAPAAATPPAPKIITGVVERITFQSAETGYTVAKLLQDKRAGRDEGAGALTTIVGTLVGVNPGEALELTGLWQHHDQHGWQFLVQSYRSVLPATATGIRKYLGSGLIKGIGPKTAEKIVAHFDVATLEVFDATPERLREVPGIGAKKVALIIEAWKTQKAIKDVMVFLQGHGVSTSLAVRIYKFYGDASITVAKNEPYRLARDVNGIGFRTADKIALAMGYKPDDAERLKAGALFALSEASDDGHTYLPALQLAEKAADLLGVSLDRAKQAIDALIAEQGAQSEWLTRSADGSLVFVPARASSKENKNQAREAASEYATPNSLIPHPQAEQVVYLWPFYNAEQNIARQIRRLSAPAQDQLAEFKNVKAEVMFDYLSQKENLQLAEKQKAGVVLALTKPVSILTGGPGTGKTTSMRALIRALQAKHKSIVLAAPTGRAAKRLSEATGVEAKTLHRLLQIKPGGQPLFNQDSPIPADIVIVDECSMLDTLLMNTLLKAIATGTHLLLVGDADQLPSVGAGNVLADLIASGLVPVVRLDRIFRQSATSAIATNAHRINAGEMPLAGGEINDFFIFAEDDTEKAGALVVDLVTQRIPSKFGFAPSEIQVLAPMHNGKCGVGFLNEALQAALNPPAANKAQKPFGNRVFRVGDKVLQMRNNYDLDVFNGDGGMVTKIDAEDQVVVVKLEDGRSVGYDFTELDQLSLAYATSIHKSQGSEYPVVVIPIVMSHYMMLERKLVYTAITRAKQLAVLVGSRKALGMAVKNAGANKSGRYTGLAVRLKS